MLLPIVIAGMRAGLNQQDTVHMVVYLVASFTPRSAAQIGAFTRPSTNFPEDQRFTARQKLASRDKKLYST